MTDEDIQSLLSTGHIPDATESAPTFIETHISWVILCTHYVYKIKKPLQYSFLDFSTLSQRKYYCDREVSLNKRLAEDMYVDVQPIQSVGPGFVIGDEGGTTVDYAVRMRRIDRQKQMDVLLAHQALHPDDIDRLANAVANFHERATIVKRPGIYALQDKFNAIAPDCDDIPDGLKALIAQSIARSDEFTQSHKNLFKTRMERGLFRDGHGDLHLRNIFLLPAPLIFDCIEFNDDYRHIDVLNEVAFLCMDLDAAGRPDFSEQFITRYNTLFPVMHTPEEQQLFLYYKAYRANVRAKVNCLRAKDATAGEAKQQQALQEIEKYAGLMDGYLSALPAVLG